MDPVLQPVSDKLDAQAQSIVVADAQITQLEDQINDLQNQLVSSQGQLALSQTQTMNLAILTNAGFRFNAQKLPFTLDPNARPSLVWFQPSNTGNTGGGSPKPHGTWTIKDFDTYRQFAAMPAGPYDDFIWGLNFFQAASPVAHGLQITDFEVLDEDLPNVMGVETNWEHSNGGFRYNGGIQALLGTDKDASTGLLVTNQWRYFDIGLGAWVYTGIPLDRTMFGTGKRIKITSEFLETSAGMTNVALTINGKRTVLNKTSKPKATTWGPYLQQGFQLDSMSSGKPLKANVYNMEAYWF